MDHQRATEAARLLRVAQEAEHARLTQETEERANLLRREESLISARRENTNLAVALAVAQKAAEDCGAISATQAFQTEVAKRVAAKA